MIRCVAAIDIKNGLADERGIPWQGKIPGDVRYYHKKIKGASTIMGFKMYQELSGPLVNSANYVASKRGNKLRDGFVLVPNATKFLEQADEDIWILGGAGLFASTIHLVDELYITQLQADFSCTKFFPEFDRDFRLMHESDKRQENNITYTFQVWKRIY